MIFQASAGRGLDDLARILARMAEDGMSVLVTGRSGSGKTALLRAIESCSERRSFAVADEMTLCFALNQKVPGGRVVAVRDVSNPRQHLLRDRIFAEFDAVVHLERNYSPACWVASIFFRQETSASF